MSFVTHTLRFATHLKPWATASLVLALGTLGAAPTVLAQSTDLSACMAELRPAARNGKVSDATWARHTAGLQADFSVIEKLNFQPEFRTAIWDYMSALVDEERVADGQARLTEHRQALERAEQRFGVDPATVVAVWGVESNFGQTFGKYPLVQALGTLSCHGRRQSYFRGEFFSALRILQAGHIAPERLVGSWAGAFGHTQFMPSTFERLAVDFDGDGRADLMDSSVDALGSTANFLARAGWQRGLPWGIEVKLPAGISLAGEGRRTKRPVAEWTARGVRRIDGAALPESLGNVGLLTLAGANGVTVSGMVSSHARPVSHAMKVYGTRDTVELDYAARTLVRSARQDQPSALGRLFPAWIQAVRFAGNGARNTGDFMRNRFHYFQCMRVLLARFYDAVEHNAIDPIPPAHILRVCRVIDQLVAGMEAQA